MKTLHNSYPAYKYNYQGVEFLVFKSMSGYSQSVVTWYLHFGDSYYISERDSAQEFNSKKESIEMAKFHINNHK